MRLADLKVALGLGAALGLAVTAPGFAGDRAGLPSDAAFAPLDRPVGLSTQGGGLLRDLIGGGGGRRAEGNAAGVEARRVTIGGLDRRFFYYVPGSAGAGAPLVLALHGGGGSARGFANRIGLVDMADRFGFIVVAADGHEKSWNADSIIRQGAAERREVDDIGFLTTALDAVLRETGADPRRVFLMGVSKGGMMAYRLACAIPDRIEAVAVVASTLSTDRCPGGADVSLLHIHGTRDESVPFEGGRGENTGARADWPAVERGIGIFTAANQCGARPEAARVTSDTECQTWSCAGGDTVELCLIENGGHGWPGVEATSRQRDQGAYISPHFDATTYIARFFDAQ